MKKLALGVLFLLSSGLTYAEPKGVTVKSSGFDGTKEITLKPYGTSSCLKSSATCISIGALWKSDLPNYVALDLLSLNKFVNMTNLLINIDGEIVQAERVPSAWEHKLSGIYQESVQRFVISKEDFNKILNAKKVWFKIDTLDSSYIETNLIDNGKETIGFQGLKRFSTQLN